MLYNNHIQHKPIMPRQLAMTTQEMLDNLRSNFSEEISAADVRAFCASQGLAYQTVTRRLEEYKSGRGKWNLNISQVKAELEHTVEAPSAVKATPMVEQNLVPAKDSTFVPFGNFADVKQVIKSNLFYPTFITGLSGNGKTFSVEQACAQLGRELIRVNITIETDEDDLIGGFRLVDGATVWHNGPVIEALQRGAVLLLDEIDLASNKILCLQSILEGKGIFLKKIGQYITPREGFNVIATANTKGKGSDDGRFIGTNVLNEAFLERFPITFEQSYPSVAIETKMLKGYAKTLNIDDATFCKRLADWGDIIRKTFYDGGVDEIISTRRLVHILRAYSIFGDKGKAINICLNRFDDETRQSFMDLYGAVDNEVDFETSEVDVNAMSPADSNLL
ncbi:hypothetical protein CC030809_00156 [Synechococcus phage S-CAM7]|uniref:ATPase dynein-related AAA domain-containing protein n=2 Tax=Synechococcus phage S-CAM7 TaxID=1883368 RepID=A0A7D5FVV8_9CAUD|nr:hypothetical protein CC030809_00156 [Synechococcus phage S-CAM7]